MREIKFRAWVHSQKRMEFSDIPPAFSFWKFVAYDSDDLKTLMQFTGLKDNNGKEIYEGDIMGSGKVVWSEINARFFLEGKDWEHSMSYVVNNDYEVIGNIYSNPELLTDKQ